MAGYSSSSDCQIQQTAAAFLRIEASSGELFRRSSNYHYIDAVIDGEVKEKIIKTIWFILHSLSTAGIIGCVLLQFWAATECGENVHLLTTTCQPFGLFGFNHEHLMAYARACFQHKLYVYKDAKEEKGAAAIGLPALAFLLRAMCTQDMHRYPEDQRPPCEDAIFERIRASYSVPIIDADKCFGALEVIITDTPSDSHDNDILFAIFRAALKDADFQSSFECNPPIKLKMKVGKERTRTTKSSEVIGYRLLVPYIGLKKIDAAKKLGLASAAKEPIKRGTFLNILKSVGIPEWPMIRNYTNARATSVPESQPVSETSSSETSVADVTFIPDEEFPGLSCEPPMTLETSDIEAWIESERALPGFMPDCCEMINQDTNAPIMEDLDFMDVEEHINIDYLNADMFIQNEGFPEQPWQEICTDMPSDQQTLTIQNEFLTSDDPKACIESTSDNEDYNPMDLFDFNSDEWIIDETNQ
ncbi:hypothetical protein E3N88_30889 [Mikania micrantha]|uniref:RWP-RK domain-containing protein n=1 Tax=Mikania micrantha TaxID=192012 RepID=A0A5N6MMW1_9ASTR|nr:hypothetical protein E3N88_30889 [Mikania micrantha]